MLYWRNFQKLLHYFPPKFPPHLLRLPPFQFLLFILHYFIIILMQQSNPSQNIFITPLGAGQEVGRSCIVCRLKDRTIIFDSGIHMQYSDMQKYPDYEHICQGKDINTVVDAVIITHFHLDHCGGLPYLTEYFQYKGPIFATTPTKVMIPYMLEDFRKVTMDIKKQQKNYFTYTANQAKLSASKIISLALQETITVKGMKITAYYAGHVLGAAMFMVEYQGLSILYTGDYNSYADRHLGAAYAPHLNPNVIITETTYATTIRDTKRDRERKMLKIVSQTLQNGGRVLIPVFALGRAQELSVLLETYWNRTDNNIPVYFSAGLIEKANFFYKLFVEWENEKIKEDFLENNTFNFKKVKPFDKSLIRAQCPYVLFATPGMLHGGTSLQVFKQWCGNPKNTLIIPGYCVPGTFGNKLLNGVRKLDIDHKQYEVNMKIENISFSAHADAKGIINLIRHVNAENIVFVHGDKQKMQVFEQVVKEQLNCPVFRPANKETIKINCTVRHQIKVNALKNPSVQGYLLRTHNNNNEYQIINQEKELLQELNLMQQILGPNKLLVNPKIETLLTLQKQLAQKVVQCRQADSSLQLLEKISNGEEQIKIEEREIKVEEKQIKIEACQQPQTVKVRGNLRTLLKAIDSVTQSQQ